MSETWSLEKLGECCDILDNFRVPINSTDRGDIRGDIPYYGANGLQGYIDKFIFDEPLILLAEDGGYFDEYETRPIAYKISGKSWVNNHAHILRAKKGSSWSQDFIFYCLQHKNITPFIKGGTRAKLNQAELKEILIQKAPEEHQLRISSILSTLDATIERTEALIAKYRQIKAGLMHDLFTRGVLPNGKLRPTREEAPGMYRETEIGWVPREWECEYLDAIATRGSGHTPNKSRPDFWNGGIKWVSLADSSRLDKIFISETEKEISPLGIENSSAILHPPGIVVLSRDAGVGKSAITTCEMAVSQHFMCWRCGPLLNNFYLYYWFQHHKRDFENIATGSTIPTIGLRFFKLYRINVPQNIDEQTRIGTTLLTLDTTIFELEIERDKLRQQKSGLMSDLLTGRVPVKVPN